MTDYERIEKIIKYLIEHQNEQPNLDVLAKQAGLSKFHFHRLFTRWAGVTPKMFLQYATAIRAKSLLNKRGNILDVSHEVGLSGPGRLHDLMITLDGVTPGEFKAKGEGIEIVYGFHPTPFGEVLIGLTKRGICHWHFLSHAKESSEALKELRDAWPKAEIISAQQKTKKIIEKIFAKTSGKHHFSVFAVGTPFQLKVWEALLKIPFGKVNSYGKIAESLKMPKASRAVGSAVGSNPVGFLIPCHRVIKATGVVGEYRWGSSRKHAVLLWEKAGMRKFAS